MEKLRHLFASEMISDVIVTGFVDRDDPVQSFHPMLQCVYVRFESCYLRCSSINQWFLQLEIVSEIAPSFDVEAIEADEYCIASIWSAFVFNSHLEHKITSFHCLLDKDCKLEDGKVKTGGFCLEHGETLFFDPSSLEGICIGSKEQVYKWTSMLHYPMENYKEEKWEFS